MGLKHESVGELRRIIESCSTARANYLRQAEAAEAAAVNEHRRLTAEGKELRLKAGRLAEKERWARIYLAEKQEPYMLKEPSPLVKVDMADLEARVLAMEAENGNLKARLAAHGLLTPAEPEVMTDFAIREHIIANWRHEWWGMMDCDRCPNSRGENGSPCKQCPRWRGLVNEHRARLERKAA